MNHPQAHPFDQLTPDFIMDAVESLGFHCDCRILALNSFENRVYQIGIEGEEPLIGKFYRPERWSREQLLEEHAFMAELTEHELPVIAPLQDDQGTSLHHYGKFYFSLSPRQGGHAPELDNLEHLRIIGRLLGRLHLIGASRAFQHRPTLSSRLFGHDCVAYIAENFIPEAYAEAYQRLTVDLLEQVDELFARCGQVSYLRSHGDCHSGNLLWRNGMAHLVDFDDSRMTPAIQDLWMLLSGDREQQQRQLDKILSGYNQFHDFNPGELQLIEPLRTLRRLHFTAWLARRWEDPAFPRAFPWFNSIQFWGEHILELKEQLAALQEPPLQL